MKNSSVIFILFISLFWINKASYSTEFTNYLNTKKSLYVWKYLNTKNFLQFVKDHKFERVYLYVGCIEWDVDKLTEVNFHNAGDSDAKKLIETLINNGIKVDIAIYLMTPQITSQM